MSTSHSPNDHKTTQPSLVDHVLSWSLTDVLDANLYKQQVNEIPMQFSSAKHYLKSFKPALIEETHADILSALTSISSAPLCLFTSIRYMKQQSGSSKSGYHFYSIKFEGMKQKQDEMYCPAPSDLIAITKKKPHCIDNLFGLQGSSYVVGIVTDCGYGDIVMSFPRPIRQNLLDEKYGYGSCLIGVHLMNMTTNLRIWSALMQNPKSQRMDIIKSVLQPRAEQAEVPCTECCRFESANHAISNSESLIQPHDLNDSQKAAILSCINSSQCTHMNTVKLIWGPPGTGKTKTLGILLNAFLNLKIKTLICAPTNIAVLEVAGRLMKIISQSGVQGSTYGLGDVVVSGSRKRMKIDEGNEVFLDVYLNHRVQVLRKCYNKSSGWKYCMNYLINLFQQNFDQLYKSYVVSETKRQIEIHEAKSEQNKEQSEEMKNIEILLLTFKEFLSAKFSQPIKNLRFCFKTLYTHLPTSLISIHEVRLMIEAAEMLESFKQMLAESYDLSTCQGFGLKRKKLACLRKLKSLYATFSLPKIKKRVGIRNFCLENAMLVFCTASGSYTLDTAFDMVVIDEAAQLKECESAIPFQACGVRHAVLVGDERQLPAMVKSNISSKANFGRSLFERLVILGHQKHLLNIQYRMHPSISKFPNKAFYNNLIQNASNVRSSSYEMKFLEDGMYGPYSFINIPGGQEEIDDSKSSRNFLEVAAILAIITKLSKACAISKKKVSVGVISPYNAQTTAIHDILAGVLHERHVSVTVRSVDEFQGGEEDVIIFSTVRCNAQGLIGFLSNSQRTNVALTRARHCLWILGDAPTLVASYSIWAKLVQDAKKRGSFHDVMENNELVQYISDNLLKLGRHDLLFETNSIIFSSSKWKVHFSNDFCRSTMRGNYTKALKSIISLLEKLSTGWRDENKNFGALFIKNSASKVLKIYRVHKMYYLAWSVDICYKNARCIQILKVWDIVTLREVNACCEHLGAVFDNYTQNTLERCTYQCMQGDIQVPMSWPLVDEEQVVYEDDNSELLFRCFASFNIKD